MCKPNSLQCRRGFLSPCLCLSLGFHCARLSSLFGTTGWILVVLHGTGWARQWKEGWSCWESFWLWASFSARWEAVGGALGGFCPEGLLQNLLFLFTLPSLLSLPLESLLTACSNVRPLQDLGGVLTSTVVPFSSGKKMGCECPESAVSQVLQPRSVDLPPSVASPSPAHFSCYFL